MEVKKVIGCLLLALGVAEFAFSFWHPQKEITWVEMFEALVSLSAGVVLYATDIHKFVLSISQGLQKNLEVKVLERFNYLVADVTIAVSQRCRKTQTGVLSYNMVLVFVGLVFLMVMLFLFRGRNQ